MKQPNPPRQPRRPNPNPAAPKPEPTLSPAVRRLVEEHDLDPAHH